MQKDEIILQAIYSAIDEINNLLQEDTQLTKESDTILYGEEGILDSLGFVNFIVAVEEAIKHKFGVEIVLTDEAAMSSSNSPFHTIETLYNYINILLNRGGNEE